MGKELSAAGQPIGNLQNGPEEKLGISNFLHIQDRKPVGTDGGTFTSGAWRTRDLNTVLVNNIVGASLNTNRITLPAGTYFIVAEAPALGCSSHVSRLEQITPSPLTLINGTPSNSPVTNGSVVFSKMWENIILSEQVIMELQHICYSTRADVGFGAGYNMGQVLNIYSDVKIWKVA